MKIFRFYFPQLIQISFIDCGTFFSTIVNRDNRRESIFNRLQLPIKCKLLVITVECNHHQVINVDSKN